MNLIEALATGQKVKRKDWWDWLTVQECPCGGSIARPKHQQCPEPALMFPDYVDPKFTRSDLLAQDWEASCSIQDSSKGDKECSSGYSSSQSSSGTPTISSSPSGESSSKETSTGVTRLDSESQSGTRRPAPTEVTQTALQEADMSGFVSTREKAIDLKGDVKCVTTTPLETPADTFLLGQVVNEIRELRRPLGAEYDKHPGFGAGWNAALADAEEAVRKVIPPTRPERKEPL